MLLTPGAPHYRTQLCPPALATSPASGAREEDERMECLSDSVPQPPCRWLSVLLAFFHRLEKKTTRTACFHQEASPLMELFYDGAEERGGILPLTASSPSLVAGHFKSFK